MVYQKNFKLWEIKGRMIKETRYSTWFTRNNGNVIPAVGLGTWQSSEENDSVYRAVKTALANGYRHIDTAMAVSTVW